MVLHSSINVLNPDVSGSMEPAFFRGDILFLTNFEHEQYKTGDIVVYKIPGVPTPIVHRVLESHDAVPRRQNKISNAGYVKNFTGVCRTVLTVTFKIPVNGAGSINADQGRQ